MGLQKKYIAQLRKQLLDYATKRRDIIKVSGDALHHAKRAIFALHRGQRVEATKKITEATTLLRGLEKKYRKDDLLLQEGSYKAALEEYVEACAFLQFVESGCIGPVTTVNISAESYIAGLCDVPGELYRFAIHAGTRRDVETVHACAEMANEIVGELIEFNLTSYLRNKFDQAKQAVQKIEHVVYELSLQK